MEIKIYTPRGKNLIQKIFEHVENDNARTWEIRKCQNGLRLTHSPQQWKDKALLNLTATDTHVIVEIRHWKNQPVPSDSDKAIYIGRFIEMLLEDFKNDFETIEIIK
ncbi:hypothetical protein [uncultured Alistipes sp.]|uniref:hypothetical protein n=1 Tax=uncultured Alistipes sp. TaxID=538949 RepID=UPI002729BD37|nr:hypothetical protein [uncultured Alistipes sp.]